MPYQHIALSPNLDTKGKREVMRLQAHKPVPLPSLEPEFVDDSAPRKPYNVDHGEQETSKVFCTTPVINTFFFLLIFSSHQNGFSICWKRKRKLLLENYEKMLDLWPEFNWKKNWLTTQTGMCRSHSLMVVWNIHSLSLPPSPLLSFFL